MNMKQNQKRFSGRNARIAPKNDQGAKGRHTHLNGQQSSGAMCGNSGLGKTLCEIFMNKSAQALGKLAKGKPKTLTEAERKRRAESLAAAREKRWPKKSTP